MGLKDIYRKLVGAGKKSAKKQQKKKVKAQPKQQKSGGSKSTGTSNHRGGSNAPSNKTQNRNTQRSSGSSGTTQRPAARAGAVGAASKGSVTPKTGAVKPTQKKKNNVSSRSGAIGAASKGSVTKVTNTSSSRGDKIANGIGYGLGYIGKEHAAKAAKALGSAAKAPQIAAERAGTGHKAGSYAPTKNERRNAAQDRVAQRRKDENAKKKAQEEAVKSGDYKNYYSASFERDSKGNIVRDKDGNAKIITNKRGATGKNVQMSQTATKAVNKGVKKIKESAESDLEKGAASFSGKKKDYEIPIYSDYKRNQARQEAKRTYAQAKKDFEASKNEQVRSAVKDFDKLVKEQGWSEDTVLNNGMTVAEYRKQYGKDVKEELDNSPEAKKQLEDYRKQLEEGAENAGKISLSSQDIYKGGTKLANELVDYLVPYAGTAKLSVKAADAAMKASKLGKAGKILTETTETGGKVLTKSGKDFVRKALADGIKEGKSTEVILKETRKKIMRNDRLTTAGKELLANAMQDASIGTTIDLAKGMEQGLEGKDLENWMKTSAVMNLAMGAPIAGIAGRTGKAGKRQLTNSLKEATNKEFATINKMTRLEGSELLRLQAKQGTTGLSEKESKRLDELTTKALDNRGGIAQIDKNGKLVTNNNGVIKDAISPQEIKDFTRLQAKQANGTLTKSDMDSFVKLSNKVEGAYAAVKDNADNVLRLGGKNVDRRSMESAVNFYKTIGDKKSLAKAQKILDKDIKNAIARNEELSSALESLANKTGVGYRFVDNNEMAAAVGEKASQDSFFIKGAYTVDKDGNPQILINRDAPQAHQTIIGHETGHIVKDANPEEFKELGEMLRSYATDKGEFEAFEKEMRTNYPELAENKEAFDEEITCELLGRYIFGDDDKFIKRLADERPSAFEKIIDYIKNLAAKIKNPELAKQLDDISKKADDIIGNIDKNKVRANAGEVRESKGYHAGDLGKSESHGNQTSERNTGAYGTGTYFVGDEKIIGNTEYGSVIYDLKGKDLARKQEIGTARFSKTKRDIQRDKIQDIFRQPIPKEDREFVSESFDSIVNSIKNGKSKDAEMEARALAEEFGAVEEITPRPEARAELRGVKDYLKGTTLHMPQSEGMARAGAFKDFKESLGPYNSRVLKIRKNTTGKNPSIGIDEAWRRIDDEYHETLLDAERRVLGEVSHEDIDEVQKFQVLADLSSRRLEDTDSRVPIPEEYDAMARDIMEEANRVANPEPAKPKETTPEEAKPEPSSTEAQKENPTMTAEEEAALKDRLGLGEQAPTKPEPAKWSGEERLGDNPSMKEAEDAIRDIYKTSTGEDLSTHTRYFSHEAWEDEFEDAFMASQSSYTESADADNAINELRSFMDKNGDLFKDEKLRSDVEDVFLEYIEKSEAKEVAEKATKEAQREETAKKAAENRLAEARAKRQKSKETSAKEAELYKKAKVSRKEVRDLTDKELQSESRSLYFGIKNGKTKEHIELRKQRQKEIDAEIERRKAETPAYAKLTDEQMGPDDPGWSIKDRDDTAPTEPETNLKVKSINKTSESVMPKSTWRTSMRRLLENSLVGFENYAKKNGNKKMLGLINNVQHSSNKFASWIEGVRSGMDRKESGKGLNAIFDDAQLFGKKNIERRTDFVNYLTYQHAIDRLKYGKPVHADPATGLSKYTADEYRQMMEDIAAKYRTGDEEIPKVIADFEKDIRGYYSDIMKMRVDSGLVSKEFAEELEEKYPHYIPTLRENDDWLLNGIESGGKQQFGISDPIKVAKGGSEELMDLYQSTLLITKDVIRDAEQNALIREYANSLGADISKISEKGQAEFPSFAAHATKTDGGWRVSFFQDGQMVTMPVDKQIALGLREINGKEYERLLNVTSKIAPAMRAFKAPITDYNIIFGVRNGARDIQQAAVNSKDLKYFTTNIPTAQASILKMNIPGGTKDPWMRSYEATGGMYSTFFTQDRKILEPGSKTGIKKGVDATAGRALRGLENINSAIEITPRMAEYIGTIKKAVDAQLRKEGSSLAKMRTDLAKEMYPGKVINDLTPKQYDKLQDEFAKKILDMADTETIEAAARNAADITLNFSRNGVIGKALNMGFVPYFNPSIQGLSKTMRMFTENKAEGMKALLNFGMKIGVITMAPAAINEIALKDNRDYQNLATREKDTNFFIPIGDGKFIKIPKPRENAVLAEPVTYGLRYFFDKARIGAIEPGEYSQWKDLGQLFISAKENIGPVPLNENLFAPIVRLAQNKTWYGGSIETVSEVLQKKEGNLKNSDIYDEGTSAVAIQIGRQKIGGKTISDISHLSPKKIDDIMDSYLGVLYDMGISQTAERTNGNPLVNQFIKDSVFSNKNGTELWAEFDKANAPKTTGGKVKKWAKDQVLGHSALNISDKSQEAQDWLNQKGYDDITWSSALRTIYKDKDYTPAQQKKIEREWKIKQNDMRRNLVYGDKEVKPGSDPVKLISEKVGVNKAMKDYTYTYVDPETGEKKNQHLDAWNAYKKSDEYKGDKKGSGEKFINFYARMRWTNGRIGESKSYPSWMTASVLAATGKGNNDELAKAYIRPDGDKDGSFQQSIVQRGKNYKEAGGTQAYFRKSQKSLFESGRKLNYDYTNKMNPWDSAMTLANDKQKFIDIAYYSSDVSGKVSRRMNYARCLNKKGYTTKQIYDFAKEYDLKLPKTDGMDKTGRANAWKSFNAKVEAAVKEKYGGKPLEEQAAVYHVITDDSYNRPFGEVGDYGLKGDTGITDLDARGGYYGGWGRRRRRGRRRRGRGGYGGWGGGGSGSGATMPETASGAIKGKVTNPFGKVADYRIKSNLDDVYRNRTKKLREATRKKLS